MKYHEMHEPVYQNLKDQGFVSWDKHRAIDELLQSSMNLTLKKLLNENQVSLKSLAVLDLGTGAGNCALFCAHEGAQATGIDASPTAIQMAHKNAELLKLKVDLKASNVLTLNLEEKFDLITDSSLLHCIVGKVDRDSFYSTVKKHLKPHGYLFIHTMTASPDMTKMIDPAYFHLDDEILWSLGFPEIDNGRKVFKDKSYFPHRTLISEEKLMQEISGQGFKLLGKIVQTGNGNPNTFIGLFNQVSAANTHQS